MGTATYRAVPRSLAHTRGVCPLHTLRVSLHCTYPGCLSTPHMPRIVIEFSLQFADGVYLVLLLGLLEDYFVPLHNFYLTPDSFDQKVRVSCFLGVGPAMLTGRDRRSVPWWQRATSAPQYPLECESTHLGFSLSSLETHWESRCMIQVCCLVMSLTCLSHGLILFLMMLVTAPWVSPILGASKYHVPG